MKHAITVARPPTPLNEARRGLRLDKAHKRLLGPLVLLLSWTLASLAGWFAPSIIPSPAAVAQAAWDTLLDGQLPAAAAISGARLLAGYAIGAVIGIALGLLAGSSPRAQDTMDGTLQALRAIPFLALAPMFSLWFSSDEASKIALVAFGATFPLYLGTTSGMRTLDRGLLEAARVNGLSPLERIREVVLPGAAPHIVTALRIGFTWSLAALVATELTSSVAGIGALVAQAREYVQTDLIFVCIMTYALFGLLADYVLRLAAQAFMPWLSLNTRN